MTHPLKKYLLFSLTFHVVFLIIFSSNLFHWNHSPKISDVTWVTLPRGTSNQLGSPMKKSQGLPKTTIEEQQKALESPPPGQKKSEMTYEPDPKTQKPDPKKPVPRNPGAPDSRIDDAIARMAKEAAKKKAEPEAAQIDNQTPGGFIHGSDKGQYVSPNDPEYVMYQAKIFQRVMNEFIVPQKFEGEPISCKIIVHINEKGDVSMTEWEQKSGNESFDMAALRAVEKASPLDIPPERLKYEVFNEGFSMEFKPQPKQ